MGNLGAGASEDVARQARYAFLEHVKKVAEADAVITAHHQDDMLETAIINLLRGTGRRGLTALKSTPRLLRPLLHAPKHSILAYAKAYGIKWREDPSNQDIKYLRNYVRHKILPEFSQDNRAKMLDHITTLSKLNDEIDKTLIDHLHLHPGTHVLDRHWFIMLPHAVARDTLASWLRIRGVQNIDSRRLERVLQAAKTLQPGKQVDIGDGHTLHISMRELALRPPER
jgi:tRNA(Ile)-lysidine synthase TilS/MesJ